MPESSSESFSWVSGLRWSSGPFDVSFCLLYSLLIMFRVFEKSLNMRFSLTGTDLVHAVTLAQWPKMMLMSGVSAALQWFTLSLVILQESSPTGSELLRERRVMNSWDWACSALTCHHRYSPLPVPDVYRTTVKWCCLYSPAVAVKVSWVDCSVSSLTSL